MIRIVSSTKGRTKKFSDKEWGYSNYEHYGVRDALRPINFVYKAEKDGKTVGIITARFTVGVLHIESLLVSHEDRHLGIGKLLMAKAESLAKKYRVHKIYLETGKGWEAEDFYKSLGFTQEGILKNHFARIDFIIYSKFL